MLNMAYSKGVTFNVDCPGSCRTLGTKSYQIGDACHCVELDKCS